MWQDIKAGNINDAAEKIIGFLKGRNTGDVIHFDGWEGFGASAVLKAVVERLRPSSSSSGRASGGMEVGVDKVIHIDCSLWQSKRALQKVIAEELGLPRWALAIIDQRDEEDDFHGVDQGSRGVIQRVKEAISTELSSCRFLVVFHNGSGSYIDLGECGVPVMDVMSKMLWTARGRFRIRGEDNVYRLAGLSNVAIFAWPPDDDIDDVALHCMHAEAEEVANYTGVPEPNMSPKIVLDCFMYKALTAHEYGIDWAVHAPNYWVCDGIIQAATTRGGIPAWEVGDALCRNMNLLDWDKYLVKKSCQKLYGKEWRHSVRWVSATKESAAQVKVPPQATSFFWTAAEPTVNDNSASTMVVLEDSMFRHSDSRSSLRVLHLSHCTFSFSSPPFGSCSDLRFILLDHCKDKKDTAAESLEAAAGACFQKLWVLELSYTDWYWLLSEEMIDQMTELRELHVKGVKNWSISSLCRRGSGSNDNTRSRMLNLSKLRVIAETAPDTDGDGQVINEGPSLFVKELSSSTSVLSTVILENCFELVRISFRGCANLKSLLLRGLFDSLAELDMSGTAVKTLDLSAMQAPHLRRLFLLGCHKLRAILWPADKLNWIWLEVLRIDTTSDAVWDKQEDGLAVLSSKDSYISLSDPRLFRSLAPVRFVNGLHVEISSTTTTGGVDVRQGINNNDSDSVGGKQQARAADMQTAAAHNLYVDDMMICTWLDNFRAGGANRDAAVDAPAPVMWMRPCPPSPTTYPEWAHCYIRMQDDEKRRAELLEGETRAATTLPGFVHDAACTLHLHDSLSVTCLTGPQPATADLIWGALRWCRLERCPNIQGCVFNHPTSTGETSFLKLITFWASQLLKARCIWDASTSRPFPLTPRILLSFCNLRFLHLDCCPRLVHVLPLDWSAGPGCIDQLETLEIVCCGDLTEIFPLMHPKSSQRYIDYLTSISFTVCTLYVE